MADLRPFRPAGPLLEPISPAGCHPEAHAAESNIHLKKKCAFAQQEGFIYLFIFNALAWINQKTKQNKTKL